MSFGITTFAVVLFTYLASPSSSQTISLTVGTVEVGNDATFHCIVRPPATATAVAFLKEGTPNIPVFSTTVGGVGSYIDRVNGTKISQGYYQIVLYNTTLSDRGSYICNMALAIIGTRTDSYVLDVVFSPVLRIIPSNADIHNKIFSCFSGPSFPSVTLTWRCLDSTLCNVSSTTVVNSTEVAGTYESSISVECSILVATICVCEASTGHNATATVQGPSTETSTVMQVATTEGPNGSALTTAQIVAIVISVIAVAVIVVVVVMVIWHKKKNSHDSSPCRVTLTLEPSQTDVVKNFGDSLKVTATVKDTTANQQMEITWFDPTGRKINSDSHALGMSGKDGCLTIQTINKEHEGKYICKCGTNVEDPIGETSFDLKVVSGGNDHQATHHGENRVAPDVERSKKKKKKKGPIKDVQKVSVPRKLPPLKN